MNEMEIKVILKFIVWQSEWLSSRKQTTNAGEDPGEGRKEPKTLLVGI
jgi:hypothetical protein